MSFLSSGNASIDYANAMGLVGAAQGRAEGYEELYRKWRAHAEKLESSIEFQKANGAIMSINTIARRLTIAEIIKLNGEGKAVTENQAEKLEKEFYSVARQQYPDTAKTEALGSKYPKLHVNI